ncbi:MAG: agmatinase [Saprospiraceae bacterium]|nr:agmatinase [Saprospiraceae bacterium]
MQQRVDFTKHLDGLTHQHIAVVGVPFDAYSSFMRGSALAPPIIKAAFHSPSANYYSESLRALHPHDLIRWIGDMPIGEYEDIASYASQIVSTKARMLALGGDHSVSFPLVRATANAYGPLTILHLDAHTDLYDSFEGNPFSHACPFARILESGLAKRLVQVGIRTMTPDHKAKAERFGIEIIEMKDWKGQVTFSLEGPVYLSLDLDVLEPGLAPGISHHEPGGMTVRDVLSIIQHLPPTLVGADIVEYNPLRDQNDLTAMIAAKCLKEILDRMLH